GFEPLLPLKVFFLWWYLQEMLLDLLEAHKRYSARTLMDVRCKGVIYGVVQNEFCSTACASIV
ncbi:hypothetical protein, partial [Anaplasma bovis]|uniref:hypothetical protein n=1 Tax=Anaplasma bovis TaxID=186733 RepID=UPI002FF0A13D